MHQSTNPIQSILLIWCTNKAPLALHGVALQPFHPSLFINHKMYPGHLRTPPLGPMSPMGTPAFGAAGGVRASPSVGPAHDYDPFRIRKPQSNAPARTKIICTLGPKSQDPEVLLKLLEAGMNVARLNFSHGSYEVNFFVLGKFFKNPGKEP